MLFSSLIYRPKLYQLSPILYARSSSRFCVNFSLLLPQILYFLPDPSFAKLISDDNQNPIKKKWHIIKFYLIDFIDII